MYVLLFAQTKSSRIDPSDESRPINALYRRLWTVIVKFRHTMDKKRSHAAVVSVLEKVGYCGNFS